MKAHIRGGTRILHHAELDTPHLSGLTTSRGTVWTFSIAPLAQRNSPAKQLK